MDCGPAARLAVDSRMFRLRPPRFVVVAARAKVELVVELIAAFIAALIVAMPPAHATTVEPLSLAELGARSDLVAEVVVRSRSSSWVGRRIITFYEVEVLDGWRTQDREAPRTALVALPGGIVDDVGQRVPGTPVFDVGARYVLCLGDDVGPRGARGVIGLWQGAWLVDQRGLVGFDHPGPRDPSTGLADPVALRAALTVGP